MDTPIENAPHEGRRKTSLRLWLKRLFFVAVWFAVYLVFPIPLETWFGYLTVVACGIWLYNHFQERLKLPPLTITFERVERVTLTHVLLALLVLFACASYSELVELNQNTREVQTDLVDIQNSASDNKDEIKSSLDDVTAAIEATR